MLCTELTQCCKSTRLQRKKGRTEGRKKETGFPSLPHFSVEETDKAGKKLVSERKDLILIDDPETRPSWHKKTIGVGREGSKHTGGELRPESLLG